MNKTKMMYVGLLALLSKPSVIYFGTPEEDAAAKAKADAEAAEAEKNKNKGKTYTQEEFDRLSATQRRAYEAETKKTAAELTRLADDKRLTQEERDTYAKRAEELESQFKTQKELEEQRVKKIETDHKKKLDEAQAEAKTYKTKYATTLIDNELTREAALAEEQVPGQLSKLLKQDTVLMDEIGEDGKTTGNQVVRVKFEDTDKDGKPIQLTLPVKEAVKRMKELPERFGNLFKGAGSGGVGAGNGKGGGNASGKLPTDTDAYITQRNAGKK